MMCCRRLGFVAAGSVLIACCNSSPTGPTDGTGCPGPYPSQATSSYVLPYEVGRSFVIGQANCGSGSHARGTLAQYAYDFLMPIGTPIVAARDGEVLLVEERHPNSTRIAGQENYINVRHADGTIAGYVHLTTNGALVSVGESVTQGQVIGLSGDSGSSTDPHLHFHVQSCLACSTEAVSFHNTRPHPQGLELGESYTAEPIVSRNVRGSGA
jgi:murein DD-endopeptidase MepM/ murein hydrolase activator NlpD